MSHMQYISSYLDEVKKIATLIERSDVEKIVKILAHVKERKGRVFVVGVGGGASNASHAVNDLRKIAEIEAYAPTDNVSELTARINDDGWEGVFSEWLEGSRISRDDCIFVLSVGGGNEEKNISTNIVSALKTAKKAGSKIVGIVGRDGGYTGEVADAVVIVPVVNDETVTPHTESFQAVIWHLVVSHPALKSGQMKWESVK